MCYQLEVYITGPCENTAFPHTATTIEHEYWCQGGEPPQLIQRDGPYGCHFQIRGQRPEVSFLDWKTEGREQVVPRKHCRIGACLRPYLESQRRLAQQPAREVETIDDFYEEGDYIGRDDSLYSQPSEQHHHETEPVDDFNEDAFDFIGPEDGPTHDDMLDYEDEGLHEHVIEDEHVRYVHDARELTAAQGLLALRDRASP